MLLFFQRKKGEVCAVYYNCIQPCYSSGPRRSLHAFYSLCFYAIINKKKGFVKRSYFILNFCAIVVKIPTVDSVM